uniref:Uncharacterized protein n=1 Tax=Helianthus annuus TaxID=4232 RepID=A0A251TYJ5_HELAN
MIHLMELPNPDPPTGKPQHGRRDRREFFARTLRRDMSDSFNNRNGGFKEAPTRFREVTNICLTTYGDTTHEHKDI